MATRTQVFLEDDIDGGKADRTVKLAVNGITYELDLSNKNADKLDKALEPFTSKARRTGGRAVPSRRSGREGAKPDRDHLKGIREWANANGHQVSDRGRISAEVVAAYKVAHKA